MNRDNLASFLVAAPGRRRAPLILRTAALAVLLLLAACSGGGGVGVAVNQPTSSTASSTYTGPAPQDADVLAFQLNFWQNITPLVPSSMDSFGYDGLALDTQRAGTVFTSAPAASCNWSKRPTETPPPRPPRPPPPAPPGGAPKLMEPVAPADSAFQLLPENGNAKLWRVTWASVISAPKSESHCTGAFSMR